MVVLYHELCVGHVERDKAASMRPDQSTSSAAAERQHMLAYANRWAAWEPWVRITMNGDHSTERYVGFRNRHHDRILLLHQALGIPMKIISRHALDDPRLTEPEMRERLTAYRKRKEVYDSLKHKRGSK